MSRISNVLVRTADAGLRTRWLVRMPVWLYRARLGFLFGNRLLMVEHIGRKSGRRRYVVLEVASLTRYAVSRPRAWAKLRPVLERTLGAAIDETGGQLPLIALDTISRDIP